MTDLCLICLDNVAAADMVCGTDQPACSAHRYCPSCVADHYAANLHTRIECPWPTCASRPTFAYMRIFLSDAQLKRYTHCQRQQEVIDDPLLRWCPTPDCEETFVVQSASAGAGSSATSVWICPACNVNACNQCGLLDHPRQNCDEAAHAQVDPDQVAWEAASQDVRRCPNASCRVLTEKSGGCNHIVCKQCRTTWCWTCGEICTIDHYSSSSCTLDIEVAMRRLAVDIFSHIAAARRTHTYHRMHGCMWYPPFPTILGRRMSVRCRVVWKKRFAAIAIKTCSNCFRVNYIQQASVLHAAQPTGWISCYMKIENN